MFEFVKKMFKKKTNKNDEEKIQKKKSSVVYRDDKRFLKLKNDDCALVFHESDQAEIVWTKRLKENQDFTNNEELLMALAIFLKQPGFGDMLINEVHRIAMKNPKIFEDTPKDQDKNKENK